MGKNSKPILSVLVDEDKKEKFAELARRHKYSMGWILNDCIDRMLEANSVDVYRASTGITEERPNLPTDALDRETIEEMVKLSIDTRFENQRLDRESIEKMVKTSIGKLRAEISEIAEFVKSMKGEIAAQTKATGDLVETDTSESADKVPKSNQQPEPITHRMLSNNDDKNDRSNPWDLCNRAARGEFHKWVGLLLPKGRSATDLQPALDKAATMGILGWRYNSKIHQFERG